MILNIPIKSIKIPTTRKKANPEKVKELAESIQAIGLLNAITIDKKNNLLAGLNRIEAFKLLDIDKIKANVYDNSNKLYNELVEIDENLIRNEMNALERGEALLRRREIYEKIHPEAKPNVIGGKKLQNPEEDIVSFATDSSKITGLNKRTIQHDIQIAEKIDDEVKEIIRETPFSGRKVDLLELARLDKPIQLEIANKLASGNYGSTKEAVKIYLRDEQARKGRKMEVDGDSLRLFCGDFMNCIDIIEPETCDLVITMPPSDAKHLSLWQNLSAFASHCLKPSGFLVAICNQDYLPDIISQLNTNLVYYWTGCLLHKDSQLIRGRNIKQCWSPILLCQKPPIKKTDVSLVDFFDEIDDNPHFKYFIEKLSEKDGVVVDPFAGGGTFIHEAIRQGRKAIGIDKTKKNINIIKSLQKIDE